MHELSIAQNIISTVQEYLEGKDCRVSAVHLCVGRLSNVLVDSLLFAFESLTEGTALAGARLVIREPTLIVRCRTCGAEHASQQFDFVCCRCGGGDVEVSGGDDLYIDFIEIQE